MSTDRRRFKTAGSLIRRINFLFDYLNVQTIKQGKDYNYLAWRNVQRIKNRIKRVCLFLFCF